MKISLNWLKELVDLSGISVEEISSKLTLAGLEVEDIHDQPSLYNNFVIGKVVEKQKHPKADKLTLCKVDSGNEVVDVICGAPNVDAGQTIVLAKEGAVVPRNSMVIKKAKIRGIESNGMICSEFEMGFSEDHSGIMVLNDSYVPGTPISEAFGLNDVIFEIGITPNRPDALSHLGVARDLSALFKRDFLISFNQKSVSSDEIHKLAKVHIKDPDLCPRYCAKVIRNVKVEESPEWLKQKLTRAGLNPVNNVVDITNYVMLLLGQPLHAFDYDLLSENTIVIRRAGGEKEFLTLDGKARILEPNDLLICDSRIPVAIAGIMGGENSKVLDSTKNILLESAYFAPGSVRKTSKRLALSTDASYRFERGIDPELAPLAAEIAAGMFAEICGGSVVDGIIDEYPNKIAGREVSIRFDKIRRILGYEIEASEIQNILQRLGFKILSSNGQGYSLSVPSFRPDIEREIDVVEEIGRIHGFEKIPDIEKISMKFGSYVDTTSEEDEIREHLCALGYNEIITISFQTEGQASVFGKPVRLLNSQSQEMEYLRTSLIPGALDVVRRNIAVGEKDLKLFEIGNTFRMVNEEIKDFSDFEEKRKISLILTGRRNLKEWHQKEEIFDFFDLKGDVTSLLMKKTLDCELFHSYYQVGNNIFDYYYTVSLGNSEIGSGGKLKKSYLKLFDIDQEVLVIELELGSIKSLPLKVTKYKELQKYPKIIRDAALLINRSIKLQEIDDCIKANKTENLKAFRLFDLYEGERIDANIKSVAYTFEYFNTERTMTDGEVEQEFNKLITSIKDKFKAKLRGE
ncbi:MAG: phenylalanine--tRNA ligase subunit beta [Ignavibacteriaceae bacterium]|nr:phenylalanine--tRNA ligase subunit beta [Ignavibacteriaceae bacterium]